MSGQRVYQENELPDGPRVCTACKVLKQPAEYGFQYGRPCTRCRACNCARSRAYNLKLGLEETRARRHAHYLRNREAILADLAARRANNPEHRIDILRRSKLKERCERWEKPLLRGCKHAAHVRGHECTITTDDIKEMFERQGGISYWIPIPMVPSPLARHPFRPSVDRLDNDKGYERSNCVLVCQCINFMRGRRTIEQMKEIVEAVRVADWTKSNQPFSP